MAPDCEAQTARERWLAALLLQHGLELQPARLAELASAQAMLTRYTEFLRQTSPVSVKYLEHEHDA
ncbi:hypothetical protein DNJ95_18715 [Stutzerimonas kirkiae]|uniref:Uncharacterized protein n=1 Tax=Stutzerimonas kirkiae TaxID=2211392 RepID=A0A4Q9QVN4_9GAMM|nr:hypothetical protein [Stutzerimonas kirkiae]TBU87749.1 hypothetical protein DNJ96_18825 [Stutzerimonas kirkiae]TBU98029.1 hypothetical protein DNJ95_18715 [Stutzerimonas kirkiae]TBV13198.1 hypothetical protein DNK01_12120 [Stutzerimonas kirkiae]